MNEAVGESRPKIHRLPEQPSKDSELYVSRAVLIVCLALLFVVIIPAIWSFSKIGKRAVENSIPVEEAKIISPTPEGDPAESLSVHDDQGKMVGQLAKMPGDVERGATINSMSKVDKTSGTELMNIISKD